MFLILNSNFKFFPPIYSALIIVFLIISTVSGGEVLKITNFTDVKGNNAIREIRIMYTGNQSAPIRLTRGVPLFAEVDFVPRYFASNTNAIALTVLIPETIRRSRLGGPWIIGWNQEAISPICRMCTNENQSYTIPVTIYLPDDGWCPEGPIPTCWKLEASRAVSPIVGVSTSDSYSNSDPTIALVMDELAQITLQNRPQSNYCVGIQEAIRYEIPSSLVPTNRTDPPSEDEITPQK